MRTLTTMVVALALSAAPLSGLERAEGHDGDRNVFPGNAAALEAPAPIEKLRYAEKAYKGEVVPIEDSDQVPRLREVAALEYELRGEKYRYTHTKEKVDELYAALKEISGPPTDLRLNYAFYIGWSFRDGVNRISRFTVYRRK